MSILRKTLLKFKSLTLKKKLIIITILLVSLIFIFNTLIKNPNGNGYVFAKASIDSITETVTETGTITTNGKTEVFSPTNGVIDEVLVSNGDTVTKGQELFTVISTATEQEQQLAYSNYLAAKSALESAKSLELQLRSKMYTYWDTYYDLSTGDNYENSDGSPKNKERESAEFQTSQDNWKAAEKQYKDQQTVISQTQASLNSAWALYQATQNSTVKSPIEGIVSNLSVINGKSVNIKSAVNLSPVLIITNNADTEIELSLTETDILKIKTGQKAKIKINAAKEKEFNGVVTRADSIGTEKQGVIRYNIYIKIQNPNDNLRPGMSADVIITTNNLSNILTVPNSAVKPYQGTKAVRILDSNSKQIKYIPVKVGIKGDNKSQIISGLNEGQEVITALSNEKIKRPGLFGN